ncbi:MAG: hypothetical protein NTW86_17975 [Candidatus Sumerlaeota bacterium]|nr:hypothetical protein [Candidatus Sumerlaeota bacterium]
MSLTIDYLLQNVNPCKTRAENGDPVQREEVVKRLDAFLRKQIADDAGVACPPRGSPRLAPADGALRRAARVGEERLRNNLTELQHE